MNKEFAKKLIKAEILRYQAIKEILPEGMKHRVETLERDAGNLLKDIAMEFISENFSQQENVSRPDQDNTGKPGYKKAVKRVDVDFN